MKIISNVLKNIAFKGEVKKKSQYQMLSMWVDILLSYTHGEGKDDEEAKDALELFTLLAFKYECKNGIETELSEEEEKDIDQKINGYLSKYSLLNPK